MALFWSGSTILKLESYLKDYVQKVWTVIARASLPKIDETLSPYILVLVEWRCAKEWLTN